MVDRSIRGTPCHPSGPFLVTGSSGVSTRERINRRCVSVDEVGVEIGRAIAKSQLSSRAWRLGLQEVSRRYGVAGNAADRPRW